MFSKDTHLACFGSLVFDDAVLFPICNQRL